MDKNLSVVGFPLDNNNRVSPRKKTNVREFFFVFFTSHSIAEMIQFLSLSIWIINFKLFFHGPNVSAVDHKVVGFSLGFVLVFLSEVYPYMCADKYVHESA